MNSQPIPQSQLPTCQVCKLQPLPESAQHLVFIILQFLFIIVNFKISLVILLVGYIFCKTVWICPLCKREVAVAEGKTFPTQDHIIIRLNDCMMLMSKFKFRIIAVVLIGVIGYFYFAEPSYQYKPRVKIEKTWRSVVANCGYQMHIQNSYKSKYLFGLYQDQPDWNLEGIFLSKDSPGKANYVTMKIKMNPTQFSNPEIQDIHILVKNLDFDLERGDVITMGGQWTGHKDHILIFLVSSMSKTGKKITNFEEIEVLSHGSLREHSN